MRETSKIARKNCKTKGLQFLLLWGKGLGQRGMEGAFLMGDRVEEGDAAAVEQKTYGGILRAIEKISVNGVADGTHVNPQLVGSAGNGL